jgi:hypothetical protein
VLGGKRGRLPDIRPDLPQPGQQRVNAEGGQRGQESIEEDAFAKADQEQALRKMETITLPNSMFRLRNVRLSVKLPACKIR